jgi:hypothetical protein
MKEHQPGESQNSRILAFIKEALILLRMTPGVLWSDFNGPKALAQREQKLQSAVKEITSLHAELGMIFAKDHPEFTVTDAEAAVQIANKMKEVLGGVHEMGVDKMQEFMTQLRTTMYNARTTNNGVFKQEDLEYYRNWIKMLPHREEKKS